MSTPQAKIDSLEAEIKRYSDELDLATTLEAKMMYGGLITERSKLLIFLSNQNLYNSYTQNYETRDQQSIHLNFHPYR